MRITVSKQISMPISIVELRIHGTLSMQVGTTGSVISQNVALELIDSVPLDRLKHPKVQSAMFTTRGGVMRDLGQRSVAIELGEKAHALMPKDYRPCTLLGAVHMELQHFEKGHEWYEKARVRGAPEQGIDSELRSIFQQLDFGWTRSHENLPAHGGFASISVA
jgi:hypothetical protein